MSDIEVLKFLGFLLVFIILGITGIKLFINEIKDIYYLGLFEKEKYEKIPVYKFVEYTYDRLWRLFLMNIHYERLGSKRYPIIRLIKCDDYNYKLLEKILVSVMKKDCYVLNSREENNYCIYLEFINKSVSDSNNDEFKNIKVTDLGDYNGIIFQTKHDIEVIEKILKDYNYILEDGATFSLTLTNEEIKNRYDDLPDFFYKIMSGLAFSSNNYKKTSQN
jgi:hypothetical protein